MKHEERIKHTAAPIAEGNLYGAATIARGGRIFTPDKFGTNLAMRSKVPPPVAEYDAWVNRSKNRRGGSMMTGFRLRRIVVMRRQGASWPECGEAVGVRGETARGWVEFLPLDLAV